jgi:hypothetical protein
MNSFLTSLLMLSTVTVGASSAFAEQFEIEFLTGPSSASGFVAKLPSKSISRQDSEEEVFFKLGQPWKRLAHGCVYRDVVVRSNVKGKIKPDTLVIDFVGGKISRLRVMPNRMLIRLIAEGKLREVSGTEIADSGF